jgi:hypothetical protein
MEETRLTKHIFIIDYRLRYKNWSAEMEQLLNFVDLSDAFDNLLPVDLRQCKNKLISLMYNEWENELIDKPKL